MKRLLTYSLAAFALATLVAFAGCSSDKTPIGSSPGNQAPVLAAIGAQSTTEGTNLNFGVSATDPNGTTPSLLASPLPTGATFTDNGNGTGTFDWTPDFTQAGEYIITFAASDSSAADSENVTLTIVDQGDPIDPNYLAVEAFVNKANLEHSWERSIDITFDLIDFQFSSSISGHHGRLNQANAAEDYNIDSASYSYTGASGWHVWTVYFTVTDDTEVSTVWGEDSLRVTAAGVFLTGAEIDTLSSLDVIDKMEIRAHFQWSQVGTNCSGQNDHSITITVMPFGELGAAVLKASTFDVFYAGVDCIDDNCTLDVTSARTATDLTFPFIGDGETTDCPVLGSELASINVNLQCTGTSGSGYDLLSVNGTWTISLSVQPEGVLAITYTDGTTTWTTTDTCVESGM